MTDYVSSIAVDDVIDALVVFLTPFAPGHQIVRAQVNRVPMPKTPCIVLTDLLQVDIEQSYNTYDSDNDKTVLNGPQRVDIQIDFYSPRASDVCNAVKIAFRSLWGVDKFPNNIKPLYSGDGAQIPMITGEQQYESRWTLTVSLQYNSIITVPQQFADVAEVATVAAVDVFEVL